MKLRQVGLRVSDVSRAVDFYTLLLGVDPIAKFEAQGFAFFDLDGVRLFLDINAPKAAIYLQVTDVREEIERVRGKGVEVLEEPHIVFSDSQGLFDLPGHEWLAFVEDSEGNAVGLMSRERTKENS